MVKRFQKTAGRLVVYVTAAMCLLAMGGRSSLAQDEAFVQQRDAEAANNASTGFTISFADERTAFHPGEAIKLLFTFRKYSVSPFNYEHCHGLGLGEAVLDHSDGTADPQADYWTNGMINPVCGLLSGVRGGVVHGDGRVEESPPIEFAVYLNQAVRFDRPGRYRLYVRSRHRFLGGQGDHLRPPLISNIVEFEIVPRDRAWETSTLEQAIRVVNTSTDEVARTEAARAISYLGTPEAIDEMAQRFCAGRPRAKDPSDPDCTLNFHWLRGLYGSAERDHVVARMEQELDRAERYVSPDYVSHLALLHLTRRSDARPIQRSNYEAQVRSYSIRHLSALKAAGRLQQHIAETLAFAAEHDWPIDRYALTSGFSAFPNDVEAAFGTLKPVDQHRLLTNRLLTTSIRNWTVLRDSEFVPMLRRLANGSEQEGPQDIALRLLYDLAPVEGRQLALRELGKRASVIGISGLTVLPDQQLPHFDNTLARFLEQAETADDYARAIDRVERFATSRILTRVRRAFERFTEARSCRLAPAALAYFFRVDPAYARTEIDNVMRVVFEGEQCETGVLRAIAERRMVPALEKVAIARLSHPNGWVVADAAEMLKQYGSADAQAPLWTALERWHERWRGQAARLEMDQRNSEGVPWDAALEYHLTEAIMQGTAWLLSDESARRLTSLCVTRRCTESIDQAFDYRPSSPSITVYPPELPRADPSFFVRAHTVGALSSRKALHRWLLLHPKGTTFTWAEDASCDIDNVWLSGEGAGFFEETRSFVESRGMKLMRRR